MSFMANDQNCLNSGEGHFRELAHFTAMTAPVPETPPLDDIIRAGRKEKRHLWILAAVAATLVGVTFRLVRKCTK